MSLRISGLVVATHTPFNVDGSLNLAAVERQAAHLIVHKIPYAFICGTTGESSSLAVDERLALAERWLAVVRGTALKVIVHVGGSCLADARRLGAQAQQLGATATAALAPSYFKPRDVATLVASMAEVAGAAPDLPFYYYEIPSMTGITHSPSEFLARAADPIKNLAGLKFTSNNLMEYQLCRDTEGGRFDIPFGYDEILLAALPLGAVGAVGSSYNFAAPIYQRLWKAFAAGDLETARMEQARSVRLISLLSSRGYIGAAKAVMGMLGVDVGPARLPNTSLSAEEQSKLRRDLEEMEFFVRVRA